MVFQYWRVRFLFKSLVLLISVTSTSSEQGSPFHVNSQLTLTIPFPLILLYFHLFPYMSPRVKSSRICLIYATCTVSIRVQCRRTIKAPLKRDDVYRICTWYVYVYVMFIWYLNVWSFVFSLLTVELIGRCHHASQK